METDRVGPAAQRGVVSNLFGAILCLAASTACADGPVHFAGSQLEPVKWNELGGWTADDHLAAFAAYQASCNALRKSRRSDGRPISAALANVCRKAVDLAPQDAGTARAFFEQNFQPVRISRLGENNGLVTGYYEPVVAGSRFASPEFSIPLYRRPGDLVAAGYKQGSLAFPNKGARISRRTENNELVPYHDRGAIEAGALDGQKLEICWLRDPFDLLAIQMEGSGRVILEDGTPLRIAYDSHNGYSYSSVERALIERNVLSRKDLSAQRVRSWMAANPEQAAKIRAANRSYVFFRVTGLTNDGEPLGAQGVPLTPGRSIAVDRVHEYGTPFFIEGNLPVEGTKPATPFGRLMIAQDTGSAIVGPARADLYWGAGDEAARIANRIKHSARFVMLLPRELDMVAAGAQMPLPTSKPKIAADDIVETEGRGKAEPARAAASTAQPKALAGPKQRVAALEIKEEAKRQARSVRAEASTPARPKPEAKATAVVDSKKSEGKLKPGPTRPGEIAVFKLKELPRSKNALEATRQVDKGKAQPGNAGKLAASQNKQGAAANPRSAAADAKKSEVREKAQPAGTGRIAANQHKPGAMANPKAVGEAKKSDSKDKSPPASNGKTAAGQSKPSATLATSKSKAPAVEVNKQGKGRSASSDDDAKATTKGARQTSARRS